MAWLRLDPWQADYDTAWRTDSEATVPPDIDLGVELPVHDWRPLSAERCEDMGELLFVDGSRRMEARVHLEDQEGWRAHGGLGTTAVGAVRVRPGTRAEFVPDLRVARWCLVGAGREHPAISLAASDGWLADLRYEPVAVAGSDPESIMQGLQDTMRHQEQLLAARLVEDHPGALIVCDGPLPQDGPLEQMIGYIKTSSVQRLPDEQLQLARELKAGERTPIHLVGQGRYRHYEWVLRLRDPSPWYYSLAGTVRLQVAVPDGENGLTERVARLADWSCVMLPGFSSQAHQDPRAPQQLLPVRALEAELKRRMGNSQILRRRIVREYVAATG